jgi:hypothetical protein
VAGSWVWWMFAQALVWPMVIEMADVLIKNSVGVSRVVNQHPVGAFGADATDEPFRVAVRPGGAGRNLDDVDPFILTMSIPSEVKTASKASVNFESRSPVRGRVSSHPEEMDPSVGTSMTNST